MQNIDPNPLSNDDVAAFNATIVSVRGQPVGICLKLRRLDGQDQLLHLRPAQSRKLVNAIVDYIENGDHQALMFQFHNDQRLTANLSQLHPYNTLLSMTPEFGPLEAGDLRRSSDVEESTFIGKGSFFTYRVKFVDGATAEFRLHECVAFNVWGFITKMVDDTGKLMGSVKGTA
ncbi:hypothetical protein [Achromobacter aloeverae]